MAQLISMSKQEVSKFEVMTKLINKTMNGTAAAKLLGLSTRQIRRLKQKVDTSGAKGLIHGNRGKPSNRKLSDKLVRKVTTLLKKHYRDFKPSFAAEKLQEQHGMMIGRETIRTIMTEEGLWQPKRKRDKPQYRAFRPRKEQYGELQQYDGSYHAWFEDRGPHAGADVCLLAAIDDATGKLTKLQFAASEGVVPTFTFWKEYIQTHGKPLNIYLDRYSTYKVNTKHLLDDPTAVTQFQRAMETDLQVTIIHAHSPQGKGRVERLFQTLQDRLVKELRLANITTIPDANIFLEKMFLEKFNNQFAVVAAEAGDLHRKLITVEAKRLDEIFSEQTSRQVNNDFTIKFKGQWLQLAEIQPILVLRKDEVIVEQRLDGSVHVRRKEKYLTYTLLPERPQKVKLHITGLTRTPSAWKPPLNHPWRRQRINSQPQVEAVAVS